MLTTESKENQYICEFSNPVTYKFEMQRSYINHSYKGHLEVGYLVNLAQSIANFKAESIFLIRLVKMTTSQALSICKDRYSTASLGNLFQHITPHYLKQVS